MGCWILGYLAKNKGKTGRAVAKSGVIDAIVLAMDRFPGDAFLQDCACRALRNITEHSESGRNAVIKADGLGAINKAMKNNPANASILVHASHIIVSASAQNPEATDYIFECVMGLLDAIEKLAACRTYPTE